MQMKIFNKKYLAIILLFTIFFISVSSADAAEHNITNTTSGGLNKTVTNSGNGDIINLEEGIYTNNVTNIIINKNLTIAGKNPQNTIIDAGKLGRIFNITFGNSLTLINVTLINGTINNGGSIFNNGTLTITNCIFNKNNATNYGGGIYNSGILNVFSSKFDNNTAYSGGAIYSYENSTMNIYNSNFTNNKVNNVGGAIDSETGALFNIINSNFINNTANIEGGAIYAQDRYGAFPGSNITNSNFINNTAIRSGGACSINGKTNFTIINSTFINNKAINNNGGAIEDFYNTGFRIINSTFRNNQANLNGGVINSYSITYIENSNFTDNKANNGGVVYSGYAMSINNSNFTNNTANTNGGGIFNNGLMIVSKNIMNGNNALLGKMIYNIGNMSVLNLTYLNNSTITANNNTYVILYANLTDDMGNTITGQNISFYVNGTFIENQTVIEGFASINFLVNHGIGYTTVTGDYAGHDYNGINIKNGQVLITNETNLNGSINFNKNKYKTNETAKGNIKVINRGENIAYNVVVSINLPEKFIANKSSIIVSNGYYDSNSNKWYIGNLNPNEEALMYFTGKFIEEGNYIASILINGDNFADLSNFTEIKVIENKTPEPNNNTNKTNNTGNKTNNTNENPNNGSNAKSAMKETGIPLIAIILVLLSSLGIVIIRKK